MLYGKAYNISAQNNPPICFPFEAARITEPLTPSVAFICGYSICQLPFLDPATLSTAGSPGERVSMVCRCLLCTQFPMNKDINGLQSPAPVHGLAHHPPFAANVSLLASNPDNQGDKRTEVKSAKQVTGHCGGDVSDSLSGDEQLQKPWSINPEDFSSQ